jgi:hypothetical protein
MSKIPFQKASSESSHEGVKPLASTVSLQMITWIFFGRGGVGRVGGAVCI